LSYDRIGSFIPLYPASGLSFILVDEQELIGEWILFVLFYLGDLRA